MSEVQDFVRLWKFFNWSARMSPKFADIEDHMEAQSAELNSLRADVSAMRRQIAEIRSLVGPFGVSFQDGTVLVQTLHGTKFFVDSNDLVMTPQLIAYRQWEAGLTSFLIDSLGPDDVFIDVGANFGYFTVLAASRIGRGGSGRVVSIEPNPNIVALLRRNVVINWSMSPVDIHQVAASESPGVAHLYIPGSGAANASLARLSHEGIDILVETRDLDAVVGPGLRVDYMKIDIEGFELFALKGARQLLERSPAITLIIEWSVGQMRTAGVLPTDLLDYLSSLGFRPFSLPPTAVRDESGWAHLVQTMESVLATDYDNLIFRRV